METDTLISRLSHWAKTRPDDIVFTFLKNSKSTPENITFGELFHNALTVSRFIRNNGMSRKPCLLLFDDRDQFINAFFGCIFGGAIPIALKRINPKRGIDSFSRIINSAEIKHVIYAGNFTQLRKLIEMSNTCAQLNWFSLGEMSASVQHLPEDPLNSIDPLEFNADDIAYLQYTSGSTSNPKGVIATHANIAANQHMIQHAFQHSINTTMVSWVPHYHDMGLVGCIIQPVYVGFRCIHFPTNQFIKNPIDWLNIITKYNATCSGAPNFAYDLCIDKAQSADLSELNLSSWKTAFNGAEPVRESTLLKFSSIFNRYGFSNTSHFPVYGMAETTLFASGGTNSSDYHYLDLCKNELSQGKVVLSNNTAENTARFVSCGRSWDINSIEILSLGSESKLAPYQIGEIGISGPHVSPGYWNAPDLMNKTCLDNVNGSISTYLRTGDLGFKDQNGDLYITGRTKELLIIRGQNLYPQDIEFIVEDSCREFLEPNSCIVFSEEINDHESLVLVAEIRRSSKNIDFSNLVKQALKALSINEGITPEKIIFINKHPDFKTTSGKKRRRSIKSAHAKSELKTLFQYTASMDNIFSNESLTTSKHENTFFNPILEKISSKSNLPIDNINSSDSIFAYGLDSLDLMELISEFEKELNCSVPIDIFYELDTIDKIASELATFESNKPSTRRLSIVEDLDRELNDIKSYISSKSSKHKVFLTGVTGFLGVYLLDELLNKEDTHIYCLIRAKDINHAIDRLSENLAYYDLASFKEVRHRLTILCGDVAKPQLGLQREQYEYLSKEVNVILHCAAVDNFYLPYAALRSANVLGTKEIIKFSLENGAKPLHYISSCAVSLLSENELDSDSIGLVNGYAKTKYVSETLVLELLNSGHQGACYRLGYLYSATNNIIDEADAFENILSAIIDIGYIPDLLAKFDLTPVEYVKKCIVEDLFSEDFTQKIKTYYNPISLDWRSISIGFAENGKSISSTSIDDFLVRFKDYIESEKGGSLRTLSPIISVDLANQLNTMFDNIDTQVNSSHIDQCAPCDSTFVNHYIEKVIDYAEST